MMISKNKSKKKKAGIIILTTLAVISIVFYGIFFTPVEVELALIAQIEVSKVQYPPIWWAHIIEDTRESFRPFDESVIDFIMNHDFSQSDLVLSWGRPLKSLTYRREGYLMREPFFIGKPTFSTIDTPTTVYIYSTTSAKGKRFANFLYKNPVKRIHLSRVQKDFFAHWFNDPTVVFQCGFYEPTTLEDELKAIRAKETDCDWYTVTDLSGNIVGETGLLRMWPHWFCTDLTIIIPNPADQGKGYGGEATRLILTRTFHHYNMNRVSIGVVGLNTDALSFYERIGFKKEGIQEQGYFYNGEFSNFVMMRILKSEYCSTK